MTRRGTAQFRFVSRWPVALPVDRLWTVIDELLASDDPMVWWPGVRTESYRRGWLLLRVQGLGYRLRFALEDLTVTRPDGLHFTATGQLAGRGEVQVIDRGASSALVIVWQVEAGPGWMRSRWVRPWLVLGHRIVMARGRRCFARWVRGHAQSLG